MKSAWPTDVTCSQQTDRINPSEWFILLKWKWMTSTRSVVGDHYDKRTVVFSIHSTVERCFFSLMCVRLVCSDDQWVCQQSVSERASEWVGISLILLFGARFSEMWGHPQKNSTLIASRQDSRCLQIISRIIGNQRIQLSIPWLTYTSCLGTFQRILRTLEICRQCETDFPTERAIR